MSGLSSATAWTSRLTSLLVILVAGCQPEPPPISWEGEVIRFGADDPDAVCEGTLEWMDRRAVALEASLAPHAATYSQVDYYWLSETWGEQNWCRVEAAGCTDDNVIHAQVVPSQHELVHALRRDLLPAVFEEGLAEYLGDIGWVLPAAPRERLQTMLEESDPVDAADYSRAGHFVAYLIETYGIERLLELADHAGYHADYPQVRDAFSTVYGVPIEEALAGYDEYPDCDPLEWMDTSIACEEDPILVNPLVSTDVEFTNYVQCSEPEVYGPRSGFVFSEATIELIPEVGLPLWVEFVGDLSSDVSVALVDCAGTCGNSSSAWFNDQTTVRQMDLAPGRYVLRFFRPLDDPGEVGLSFGF